MPVNYLASALSSLPSNRLVYGAAAAFFAYGFKAWVGGRRNTWERDWTGKMILIVAPPSSAILSLIHHLLHLPKPPQILFLPPLPSPLPDDLLTILHTIRLSAEKNPAAQLHCEPLPRTPGAVQDFTRKWGTGLKGTVAESGRRVDAIILGEGWEVVSPSYDLDGHDGNDKGQGKSKGKGKSTAPKEWSILQFQYHLLTSLLPSLLRAPADRSIRIITLISPSWAVALPSLQSKPLKDAPLTTSALRGLTTLLVMRHFQLILDTLYSAAVKKETLVPVPDPEMPDLPAKKRDEGVKSNIMSLSVVMPWTRGEVVRGTMGADESLLGWVFYILLYPFLLIFTPSSSRAIHSILFALSAPIRQNDTQPSSTRTQTKLDLDIGGGVMSGGDVVRNCQIMQLPPVMQDPNLARANYEALEREVEGRIKAERGG